MCPCAAETVPHWSAKSFRDGRTHPFQMQKKAFSLPSFPSSVLPIYALLSPPVFNHHQKNHHNGRRSGTEASLWPCALLALRLRWYVRQACSVAYTRSTSDLPIHQHESSYVRRQGRITRAFKQLLTPLDRCHVLFHHPRSCHSS